MPATPNKNYTIQVWITTLLLGPVISSIALGLYHYLFFVMSIFMGAFASLPVFLLHLATFNPIARSGLPVVVKKLLLAFIAMAGAFVLFAIFQFRTPKYIFETSYHHAYGIAILAASLIFPINNKKSAAARTSLAER